MVVTRGINGVNGCMGKNGTPTAEEELNSREHNAILFFPFGDVI